MTEGTTCIVCGEPHNRRPGSKFCSHRCQDKKRWREEPGRRAPRGRRETKQCEQCFTTYSARVVDKTRYCSTSCGAIASRARNSRYGGLPPLKSTSFRARAIRYGVLFERFKATDIFNRDNWQCGICAGAIKRSLKYPDPMSASLDHIVPMSHGGDHVPANVQAAHLRCNVAKGTGYIATGEQLRLIG